METLKRIIGPTRRTDVSFYSDGRVELSSYVVKTLGLRHGDVVDVASDGHEYFLFAAATEPRCRHRAQCRETNPGGKHFRFNSVRLARTMLAVAGAQGRNYVHLPVGDVVTAYGRKALTIITHLSNPYTPDL
jgi:anaerobic selenocysteine-containing dehydrogenase